MTAVEWLINELQLYYEGKSKLVYYEIIEQAKEMEKQQIIDAFDEGQEYEYQYHINNTPKFDSQTYYNETYGSKGSETEGYICPQTKKQCRDECCVSAEDCHIQAGIGIIFDFKN